MSSGLQVSHSWKAFGVSVLDDCGCTGAARPFGFSQSSWSGVCVPHMPEEGTMTTGGLSHFFGGRWALVKGENVRAGCPRAHRTRVIDERSVERRQAVAECDRLTL